MGRKGIIDRFEGEWAVVEMEDGEFIDVPVDTLPPEAVEGSLIYMERGQKSLVLKEETDNNKDRIRELMDSLFED